MKTKLTRERIFQIWYVLTNLKVPENEMLDKRFDYAKNRTLDSLTPEVTEIVKARKSGIPKYDEFDTKRKEILMKYASKDEQGNPVINGNQFSINGENLEEANKSLNELTETYKEALDERQKEIDIYNEIINEEIDIDITQLSFNALPNFVKEEFTKVIRPMIKETDEEIEGLL